MRLVALDLFVLDATLRPEPFLDVVNLQLLIDANNTKELRTVFGVANLTNSANGFSNLTLGLNTALLTVKPTSKLKVRNPRPSTMYANVLQVDFK